MASIESKASSLDMKYTNWKWSNADIHTTDSNQLLYSIDYHCRKPQLRLHRAGNPEAFATATLRLTSRKIDIELPGRNIELKGKKWYNMNYEYVSPAFQGQTLTWNCKSRFKSYDFVLLDEKKLPVAKMVSVAGLSMMKLGSLEFTEGFIGGDDAREEILITSLALSYVALQNTLGAAAA